MNEVVNNISDVGLSYADNKGYDPYDDNMHENPVLLQYWQAALRYKLAILAIIVSTIAIGFIITLLTTPYYTSVSRIEINREQDKVTNIEGVEASDSASQSLEFYQTQYALLEARSLAERVVRDRNLISRDEFFESFNLDPDNDGIISQDGDQQTAAQRSARLKSAIKILQDNIAINPVRGSSLVDVSFNSPNPSLSAEIVNSWVEQFIDSSLDRRFNSTAEARKLLEEQLESLRQKLEVSERNLNGYADTKEIITISEQKSADGKTISQQTLSTANLEVLNQAYADAIADRILAQSAANQSSGDKNALANTTLNRLREERATAQAEYDRLLVQFEPEYPTAKAIATQIASLSSSIRKEEARSRSATVARYKEAVDRENKLKSEVDALKGEYSGQRRDTIQFDIFQREVDTNRQLYESLLQRYKEIGVAGVATNNISVVDKAERPDKPSSPIIILNLLLAFIAGTGLAAAYVFIMEQIDQTIKEASDLKTKVGLSPLGIIPDLDKQDIIEDLQDKKSMAWEAYLSIRTSLSFLTDHGVPKSFLLTSTRPNEGKSTSAFAIAAVLASGKRKILLIDGDMRNPSLHKITGGSNVSGLSNYLSGSDNIRNSIFKEDRYNFDVLTAGPIPPNAAELLSSERLKDLILKLGEVYDTIIIDSPPVLGLADIPILANSVEGVIYTVEAGGVKVRGIQSALQRIRSTNAHIFGAIITKIPQNSSGYGYAYQYSYGQAAE